ncbi:MAG TPA: hypothetical protein DCF68_06430 [Cyanothece sp. UBA12306]|nr:hypothetical protein [Cyanothece sp. UBA12306]
MKVFVYGTLKPGECNYRSYCQKKVIEIIKAYTYGQLYHLSLGYPAMTRGNQKVQGYLLKFFDDTVLQKLDDLEDYYPLRSPQDSQYLRQNLVIYSPIGELLGEAWGYLMTVEKIKQLGGKLITSGWWTQDKDY